jgi:hypothetical protein
MPNTPFPPYPSGSKSTAAQAPAIQTLAHRHPASDSSQKVHSLSTLERKSLSDVLPGRGKRHVNRFDCAIIAEVTKKSFRAQHCIAPVSLGISTT